MNDSAPPTPPASTASSQLPRTLPNAVVAAGLYSHGHPMPSPPDTVSNAAAPEATADPQQWVNREDFLADYNGQINSNYPDKAWARCQNGVPQRAVHWSPARPVNLSVFVARRKNIRKLMRPH